MNNVLTRAARRVMGKDVRRPPSPIEARDQYSSMVYSIYDQKPGPSPRLIETALSAIRYAMGNEVDLSDIGARPGIPDYFHVWPGEHYRLLAGLMLTLRPRIVIEIGTFTGLSALTLKKYLPGDGKLATFDVRDWATVEGTILREDDFADGRLHQFLDNLLERENIEKHRDLLESADFFFIDAPKDGVFEYKLMEHFSGLKFRNKPVAFFDDTRLWSMLKFWRELPHPKLDLTSFGAWSGSGLVEFA